MAVHFPLVLNGRKGHENLCHTDLTTVTYIAYLLLVAMVMTSAPRVKGAEQESDKGATDKKMNFVCAHTETRIFWPHPVMSGCGHCVQS